jgi:hypothetical protein
MESVSTSFFDFCGSERSIRIRLDLVVVPVFEALTRWRMQVGDGVARMTEDREERGRKRSLRKCVRVAVYVRPGEDDQGTEEDEEEGTRVAQESECDTENPSSS